MSLSGKRALVTGASRGIGRAIAQAFAKAGMRLFLVARDEKDLAKLKAELSEKGTPVDFAAADLSNPILAEEAFEKAIGFLGGIDVLVNNAGANAAGPVADLSLSNWDMIQAVNLRAPYLLSKLAAGRMISQGSGHIINIGSGASQTSIAGNAAYCASKYGLLGFSESLALELRQYGIKVLDHPSRHYSHVFRRQRTGQEAQVTTRHLKAGGCRRLGHVSVASGPRRLDLGHELKAAQSRQDRINSARGGN